MPDEPVEVVTLKEVSGPPPEEVFDAQASRVFAIQVMTRSADYPTGRTRARDAYDALDKIANQDVNGTTYLRARPIQEPHLLDQEKGRDGVNLRFTFNVIVWQSP